MIRIIRSKGAVIVLIINLLIDISYYGALGQVLSTFLSDVLHLKQGGVANFLGIVLIRSFPQLVYPIAGFLADIRYGRYKVITAGLWIMLAGYSLMFVAFLVRYFYQSEWGTYITYFCIFPLSLLAINLGLAAFQANIIPFGLDQMPTGSSGEVSAFVHWFYGVRNIMAGIVPSISCLITTRPLANVVHTATEIVLLLIALSLCYFLKRFLIIEPQSENPFKTLYKVLKFASKNKVPLNRSAFTYWEDDIPSRIDLGKQKYGGPFTVENVEDVKTFIRILIVLMAVGGYVIGYYIVLLVSSQFSLRLHNSTINDHCSVGQLLLIQLDTTPIFLFVCIYELIIFPLFGKFTPSILRKIGIGMIVGILAIVSLFVLDGYGHSNYTSPSFNWTANSSCYLVDETPIFEIDIKATWVSVPYLLSALSETIVFIAALEFICAQAPYSMRGMLIGVYYFSRGLFGLISAILLLSFSLGFQSYPLPQTAPFISCGVPVHITTLIIAVLGVIGYAIVARLYRKRERDENFVPRIFIEKYYGAMINMREEMRRS